MRGAAWMVGLGLVIALPARAQAPLPLELTWEAPATCGSAAEVRTELERIAHAVPGYALEPLRAHAQVEQHAGGYAVRLLTEHEGERGERRLEAADCPTLVRSLTLVLALAFGKGVELAEPASGNASTPAPSATPASAPDAEATKPAAPTPPAAGATGDPRTPPGDAPENEPRAGEQDGRDALGLRVSLLLGAGVQLALLPAPAGTGMLGVEVERRPWSIALRVSAWPGIASHVAPALDARFDGLAGTLQGCGGVVLATLDLSTCAAAHAAALRGRSEGAFEDGSQTAPWLALGGAAAVSWPADGALRVRLEGAVAASLARPRFVVAGFGPVHRVPQLAPALALLVLVTP